MKCNRILFNIFLFALLFNIIVSAGKGRSRPTIFSSKRSKYGKFGGIRSSGLSSSAKSRLLLSAGVMSAAYIGFKFGSLSELNQHTICKGDRSLYNEFGEHKWYKYTVCPRSLPFCCQSRSFMGEECCSGYYSSNHSTMGSIFGIIFLLIIIGVVIYMCHRRKRSQSNISYTNHLPNMTNPSVPPVSSNVPYTPTYPDHRNQKGMLTCVDQSQPVAMPNLPNLPHLDTSTPLPYGNPPPYQP